MRPTGVAQRAQGPADRRHATEAGRVDLKLRRTLLDRHGLHPDLLNRRWPVARAPQRDRRSPARPRRDPRPDPSGRWASRCTPPRSPIISAAGPGTSPTTPPCLRRSGRVEARARVGLHVIYSRTSRGDGARQLRAGSRRVVSSSAGGGAMDGLASHFRPQANVLPRAWAAVHHRLCRSQPGSAHLTGETRMPLTSCRRSASDCSPRSRSRSTVSPGCARRRDRDGEPPCHHRGHTAFAAWDTALVLVRTAARPIQS